MELGVLEIDNLLDVLSFPQLFLFEIWIETIHFEKIKIKALESTKSELNKAKSATTVKSVETVQNEVQEDNNIFWRDEKNRIGRDDYILSNGLKPLRIRFNLFDLKQVNILAVEFNILQLILENNSQSTPEISQSNSSMKSGNETSAEDDETENTGETQRIRKNDNANSSRKHKKSASKYKKKRKYDADATSAKIVTSSSNKLDGKSSSDDIYKSSAESSFQHIFHLDEVFELLNEDIFVPKNEIRMRRGAHATFAMAPLQMIQSIQRGKIILTVDRFGGRLDDEGDLIGQATVTIPQTWIESVLKVANQPNLAPIKCSMNDNISILDNGGSEIGRIEFMMKLQCLGGCLVSSTMPTQLGLYISVIDGSDNKQLCHKPVVRDNIAYRSVMRKSFKDDYDTLYKPSCTTESLRPSY